MFTTDRLLNGLIVLMLALAAVMLICAVEDARRWPAYRAAHHCVKTGRTDDQLITTVVSTGSVTVPMMQVVTSEEWQCDNGSIWR